MIKGRFSNTLAILAVVFIVGVICVVTEVVMLYDHGSRNSAGGVRGLRAESSYSAVAASTIIDSDVGETLSPPPTQSAPLMTADAAYGTFSALATSGSADPIPSNDSVQLGFLYLPTGSGAEPQANNELVWAYSYPSNCVYMHAPTASQPTQCTRWIFLNANTGQLVDQTYQPVIQPAN